MSLRERFRRWQVRRRRKRAARRHEASALREFVYLDEVSVFSLISSRLGPVATEFTATESSSLTGELTGTAGVSAGVLKSELKARSEATQTHGTQVLRKATVQATLKNSMNTLKMGLYCGLPRPSLRTSVVRETSKRRSNTPAQADGSHELASSHADN